MIKRTVSPRHDQHGFTIVELLIVIVVIAILAAIVIVAYTGIQNKAHSAAAQAASNTVAKLLTNSYTTNGAYPNDLATINNGGPMPTTDGSTYAYHPGAGNASYCVTVTNGNSSYKVTDSATQPTAGGCPGDGVNGLAPITNLATNPSFETDASGWGSMNCSTLARDTTMAYSGSTSYKCVSNSTVVAYFTGPPTSAKPGDSLTMSAYVRSDQARQIEIYISALDGTNTEVSRINSIWTTLAANTWTRVTASGTMPANTVNAKVQLNFRSPLVGQQNWVDAVMYVSGSQSQNYADGSSPNWVWNGTVNNSTSTGPAQ